MQLYKLYIYTMASKVCKWITLSVLLLILGLYSFNRLHSSHLNNNIRHIWEDVKVRAQKRIENATLRRGTTSFIQNVTKVDQKQLNTSLTDNLLLVMIPSAFSRKERRAAIRETWKNSYVEQGKQFLVKFVIGTMQLNAEEKESVSAENRQHNDLLILTDHMDSYDNLTRKILEMFIWADKRASYFYLLKVDDDSFARLDVIESELRARESTKGLYGGYIAKNSVPKPRGKWKEDKWFLCKGKYLPYAVGAGYVLSADLVHRIVVNADALTLYNSEDVSVGVWTSSFDIERKHDDRIRAFGNVVCNNDYVILHHQTLANFREKHKLLTTKGIMCNTQH